MSKTRIHADSVLSKSAGYIKFADSRGTLRTIKAEEAEIYEGEPDAPVATEAAAEQPAPATVEETTPATPPAEATEAQPTAPKKKRGKSKEKDVAKSKKKAAPAKKKAAAPRTEGSGVRTIGGKAFDASKYVRGKSSSGGVTLHNGDQVAELLAGKELDEVYSIAAKKLKGVEEKELRKRFGHLNTGMQRMNLGNMLRKALVPKEKRA